MKERIDSIINSNVGSKLDRFYNSVYYIIAIGLICILCHTVNTPIVGAALLTALLVPALLFCKNTFVLAPFFLMCSFVISEETMPQYGYYNVPWKIAVLCVLLVFLVAAFAFNLVYYKKWRVIFKRGSLTVSFIPLSLAFVLGGVFTKWYAFNGVGTGIAIALTSFGIYTLLVNCGEYGGKKTVDYLAWAVIVAAMVIGAAVLKQYVINDFNIDNQSKGTLLRFGYAISNTAAAIVVIAIPFTFYFIYKYKHGYWLISLVALELLIIFATYSRASIVVAVPGSLIVAVWLCFKKNTHNLRYYIACGLFLAAALAVLIMEREKLLDILTAASTGDFRDSGRFELWELGFDNWKTEPIFGIGLWFLPQYGPTYYSFHCTPLTYLYCGGLAGFVAYVYHRYKTVRLFLAAKPTAERVFLALAVLAMLINALLDIGMTSPPHLMYYAAILAALECDNKRVAKQQDDSAKAPDKKSAIDAPAPERANTDAALTNTTIETESVVTEEKI